MSTKRPRHREQERECMNCSETNEHLLVLNGDSWHFGELPSTGRGTPTLCLAMLHCRTPQLGKRASMEQVSLFLGIDQRALSMGGFLPWQNVDNKPQGATKPNQNQAKAGRTAPSPEVGAGVGEPLVGAGQSLSWPSVGLASSLWEVGSLCGIPKCYK